MLSLIAKLNDPHGFLSPILIMFKNFNSTNLGHGTKWDDNVPPEIASDFECQFNEFSEIHTIHLPRPIVKNQLIDLQLHMFSDAPKKHTHRFFTVEQRIG